MNMAEPQEEAPKKHPIIITPGDQERWPLMEMVSQPCPIPISPADEQAVLDMDRILDYLDEEAAGLAAVQIGVPRRIFVLRNGPAMNGKSASNCAYINPVVLSVSKETKNDGEACLSLPGMGARIRRPKKVTLQYFDLDSELQTETFEGFWARAVCHEMAHLDGKLITHELEKQLTEQTRKTKYGMRIDSASRRRIEKRRAKNKAAKKSRCRNR